MATKKQETYTVEGKFSDLRIGVEVKAADLAGAVEAAKSLKFSDFISECGDVHDYSGPEITSAWKNA